MASLAPAVFAISHPYPAPLRVQHLSLGPQQLKSDRRICRNRGIKRSIGFDWCVAHDSFMVSRLLQRKDANDGDATGEATPRHILRNIRVETENAPGLRDWMENAPVDLRQRMRRQW